MHAIGRTNRLHLPVTASCAVAAAACSVLLYAALTTVVAQAQTAGALPVLTVAAGFILVRPMRNSNVAFRATAAFTAPFVALAVTGGGVLLAGALTSLPHISPALPTVELPDLGSGGWLPAALLPTSVVGAWLYRPGMWRDGLVAVSGTLLAVVIVCALGTGVGGRTAGTSNTGVRSAEQKVLDTLQNAVTKGHADFERSASSAAASLD